MNCLKAENCSSTDGKPAQETPWALDRLPPFPWVATRLMQMYAAPDVSISEIGRVIAQEPVFAARVLQTANSPLFAVRAQVKSLSHAIILLGLNRVRAITITRALGDFVAPILKIQALRACWQNGLAAAILSEKLARACKMDPDFAYLGGLMRDIGRLALLVKYPEAYANLLAVSQENSYDLLATEHDLFDIDHCQAGAWIVGELAFPAELREVIAWHHETLDPHPFRVVHLVHIADLMADALGFSVVKPGPPQSYQDAHELLPPAARDRFAMDPDALAAEIESRIQAWQ
ncbi:MAG TPA: HDOD domain-containing protein [Bryobacteraceae bacterium]|nr:HDOD domain-containing protein [Bryobacteraceae bacterium]